MKSVLTLLLAILFSGMNAEAATRKVYFSVVGRNYTNAGLTEQAASSCIISVTNSSNVQQNITVDLSSSFSQVGIAKTPAPGTTTFTDSLDAAGGTDPSETYTITFDPVLVGQTAYTQDVTCSGSIQVVDASTPGFVTANGSLVTFYESGAQTTQNVSGGNTSFGQQAVFSQIAIPINGGKPF